MQVRNGVKYISEREFKEAAFVIINDMCDEELLDQDINLVSDWMAKLEAKLFVRKNRSWKVK